MTKILKEEVAEFASDIGLAPGIWPRTIVYIGKEFDLYFVEHDAEGDVTFALYKNDKTLLRVFND